MPDHYLRFKKECDAEIERQGADVTLRELTVSWMEKANRLKYSYHFEWLGRPIIQYPQDIVAMQEIIWQIRPDLIIETGIAHGGSLVLGIDIDIRPHNREAIEIHPMFSRIQMIQGSSIDPEIIDRVHRIAADHSRVLVCLDSNHTHAHVLAELQAYAPLVTKGSYCVVFDTIIEDMPADMFPDRPWGPGNNPKTAVWEYLKDHPEFEIDKSIEHKLLITAAPHGFLKRT